jgi:hypothetical protein
MSLLETPVIAPSWQTKCCRLPVDWVKLAPVAWALLQFLNGKDMVVAMPTRLSHQPGHRPKIWDHRLSHRPSDSLRSYYDC